MLHSYRTIVLAWKVQKEKKPATIRVYSVSLDARNFWTTCSSNLLQLLLPTHSFGSWPWMRSWQINRKKKERKTKVQKGGEELTKKSELAVSTWKKNYEQCPRFIYSETHNKSRPYFVQTVGNYVFSIVVSLRPKILDYQRQSRTVWWYFSLCNFKVTNFQLYKSFAPLLRVNTIYCLLTTGLLLPFCLASTLSNRWLTILCIFHGIRCFSKSLASFYLSRQSWKEENNNSMEY